MIGEETVTAWLPMLGSLVCKSLLVFAVATGALWGLRHASAALRHLVCLLTLAALLILPVLSLTLPGWRLPVLIPTSAQAPAPTLPSVSTLPLPPTQTSVVAFVSPPSARLAPLLVLPTHTAASTPPHLFLWAVLLPAFWLLGLLLAGLRPLLGLWGIAHLSRASVPVNDTTMLALADECASALRLMATPILCQADAPVPMTWGGQRPVVLLPLDAQAWPDECLRAVLLHEMAHVRRRDWLSHRFADLVCALYWFHPFVWLTARRLRSESEIACDDLVLTSGLAAPDYARHLLEVARALQPVSRVPRAAIAMARNTHIEGRLKMILDPVRSRQALTHRVLLFVLTPGIAALVLLAMLRPTAKAQSAPISAAAAPAPPSLVEAAPLPVAVPPAVDAQPASPNAAASLPVPVAPSPKTAPSSISPVHPKVDSVPVRLVKPIGPVRVSAKGPTITLQPSGKSDPLVLTASLLDMVSSSDSLKPPTLVVAGDLKINGTTLLAGVTDADKPGSSWWSAEGALLPSPVYDTALHRAESHGFGTDTKNVIFAFRFPASAQDLTVRYEVPQSTLSSSNGSWLSKLRGQDRLTEAQINAKTNGTRVLTVAFPQSLSKANLRVGVASGPWKTLATDTLSGGDGYGSTSNLGGNSKFIFGPVLETKNDVVVTISTDANDDLRVVAVDAQGHESLVSGIGDTNNGTLDQITAHFAQPLDQIKEIRVQTRPFRWMEIKDIALQPAK